MLLPIDLSKKSPTTFEQGATLVAVVELSLKSWLVAGIVPGIDRHPLKKFEASENRLLALLGHWQQQAVSGHGGSLGDVKVVVRFRGRLVLDVVNPHLVGMAATLVRFHQRRDPIRLKAWGFPIPYRGL